MPVQPDTYEFIPATVFPGGVAMYEAAATPGGAGIGPTIPPPGDPTNSLKWVRDGATRGYIFTTDDGPNYDIMKLGATHDVGRIETRLELGSAAAQGGSNYLAATILHPTQPVLSTLILDGNGRSNFLQWKSSSKTKMQILRAAVTPAAAGTVDIVQPLPAAWGATHDHCIVCAVDYQTSGSGAEMQCGPRDLGNVNIRVWNNPAVQNITFTVLSFGTD